MYVHVNVLAHQGRQESHTDVSSTGVDATLKMVVAGLSEALHVYSKFEIGVAV